MKSQHIYGVTPRTDGPIGRGQPWCACGPNRWAIFDVIKDIHIDIGLSARDLTVLRAMLSLLPHSDHDDPAEIDLNGLLMVYASTRTLSLRADGMHERTMSRAISSLVKSGLVLRRDSSSKKRFPVKIGGKVVAAFGFDLSPLIARTKELVELSEKIKRQRDEFRALRSNLLSERRIWLENPAPKKQGDRDAIENLVTVLRRKLTLSELQDVARNARAIMQAEEGAEMTPVEAPCPLPEAIYLSASDRQSVRHIESKQIKYKNYPVKETNHTSPNDPLVAYREAAHLRSFYPEEPRTLSALQQIVFSMSKMLSLEGISQTISRIGWYHTVRLLDHLCDRISDIRSPQAYLGSIISRSEREGCVLGKPL